MVNTSRLVAVLVAALALPAFARSHAPSPVKKHKPHHAKHLRVTHHKSK